MSVFQAMNVDRRFVLRNDNTLVDMEVERQRLGAPIKRALEVESISEQEMKQQQQRSIAAAGMIGTLLHSATPLPSKSPARSMHPVKGAQLPPC